MVIGKIVELEPACISVFSKFGIDVNLFAHLEFEVACKRVAADENSIKQALLQLAKQRRVNGKPFNKVVNTILKRHHNLKEKANQTRKVIDDAILTGSAHTYELLTIRAKFNLLIEMLEVHQYKEEVLLFPEFVQLWRNFVGVAQEVPSPFLMDYPIERLREEHQMLSRMIDEIRQLRQYYSNAVPDLENKNRVNEALFDFECGLTMLIQLEDTILFPSTLDMETEVQGRIMT